MYAAYISWKKVFLDQHTSFAMAKEVLDLKGDPRCVEISDHPRVVDCSDVNPASVEASLVIPIFQAEGALRKLRLKKKTSRATSVGEWVC